jgi:poly [ADP-ribose] polymerase
MGHNKYYKMTPNPDGQTWTAEWGRIGKGKPQTKADNPNRIFEAKYNEKIKKKYEDQTDLMAEDIDDGSGTQETHKPITIPSIADVVRKLQEYAHVAIKKNYTVSATKVTMAMVDEAQRILDALMNAKARESIDEFNDLLLRLFKTIPRRMDVVQNYMANKTGDFDQIIVREQDLLDTMKGQVKQNSVAKPVAATSKAQETILDAMGLVFEECDDDDIAKIKAALGKESEGKLRRAWRVTNLETQKRYDDYVEKHNITNTKLLFHGSRNENWWSILASGLVLRPTNAIINGKILPMNHRNMVLCTG